MPKQSGDDLDDKDRISARVGGGPGARALLIVRLPIFVLVLMNFSPTVHCADIHDVYYSTAVVRVYIYKILMALVS